MIHLLKKIILPCLLLFLSYYVNSQSSSSHLLIPARIVEIPDNNGNFNYEFNSDGSLTVKHGTLVLHTPIAPAKFSQEPHLQHSEYETLVINPDDYLTDQSSDFYDNPLQLTPLKEDNVDYDDMYASIHIYRRPELKKSENSKQNSFGYGSIARNDRNAVDDTYLIFGKEYSDAFTSEGWVCEGEYDSNFSFEDLDAPIYSDDYVKLWNRPKSAYGFMHTIHGKIFKNFAKTAAYAATVYFVFASVVAALEAASVSATTVMWNTWGAGLAGTSESAIQAQFFVQYFSGYVIKTGLLFSAFNLVYNNVLHNTHLERYQQEEANRLQHFSPQRLIKTNQEIEIPESNFDNVEDRNDWFTQLKKEYDKITIHTHPCSYDNNKSCYYEDFSDAYAVITITNATLRSITFPGLLEKSITPYRLFKKYGYQIPIDDETIIVSGDNDANRDRLLDDLRVIDNPSDIFEDIDESQYPKNMLKAKLSDHDMELTFKNYNKSPQYLYLVHHEVPEIYINGSSNKSFFPADYYHDLGVFGKIETPNGEIPYHLYRFLVKKTDINEDVSIMLQTTPNGPFLAGNNLFVDNPHARDAFVINGDDNMMAKIVEVDDNGTPTLVDHFEGTVYGNMAIFSDQVQDPSTPLTGTDKWALYVGGEADIDTNTDEFSPPTDVGALTEDAFITAQENMLLPDYVFEPHYNKQTLSELEAYIKENKHLPDVPGLKEVEEVGYYKAPEMMFGQLKNLEELYLHTFEQQEKLNQLKMTRQELQQRVLVIKERITNLLNN